MRRERGELDTAISRLHTGDEISKQQQLCLPALTSHYTTVRLSLLIQEASLCNIDHYKKSLTNENADLWRPGAVDTSVKHSCT